MPPRPRLTLPARQAEKAESPFSELLNDDVTPSKVPDFVNPAQLHAVSSTPKPTKPAEPPSAPVSIPNPSPDKIIKPASAANSRPVSRPRASNGEAPLRRTSYGSNLREFRMGDGRPFTVHRHSCLWATPLKADPENMTLVGIKGGEKPVPLAVKYLDFLGWWHR